METVNEQVMPFAHAYISKEKKDREKQSEMAEEEQRDEDGNVIAVRKNLTTPITTAKKKLAESASMGSSGGVEENSKLAASNSLLRNLNPHGLVPPGRRPPLVLPSYICNPLTYRMSCPCRTSPPIFVFTNPH